MTWILQNNINKEEFYYFDCESDLDSWVEENIAYSDRTTWTKMDPEGGEWFV